MRVEIVPLSRIKPDPNQPRKTFPEDGIRDLSKSLLQEGFINPIEVDKDLMIITGERRYRAAKMAKLVEIPVHINEEELTPVERLRRQIVENVLQGRKADVLNMGVPETLAAALRFLELSGRPLELLPPGGDGGRENGAIGSARFLAAEIGGSVGVWRNLLLLRDKDKEILGSITPLKTFSTAQLVLRAPEALREKLKERFLVSDAVIEKQVRNVLTLAKRDMSLALLEAEQVGRERDTRVNSLLFQANAIRSTLKEVLRSGTTEHDRTVLRGFLKDARDEINDFLSNI